jgi:hypothetical protein
LAVEIGGTAVNDRRTDGRTVPAMRDVLSPPPVSGGHDTASPRAPQACAPPGPRRPGGEDGNGSSSTTQPRRHLGHPKGARKNARKRTTNPAGARGCNCNPPPSRSLPPSLRLQPRRPRPHNTSCCPLLINRPALSTLIASTAVRHWLPIAASC